MAVQDRKESRHENSGRPVIAHVLNEMAEQPTPTLLMSLLTALHFLTSSAAATPPTLKWMGRNEKRPTALSSNFPRSIQLVKHVGTTFLIGLAIREFNRSVAMPLIESACSGIRLKRVEANRPK